jgi:hypothetical protein
MEHDGWFKQGALEHLCVGCGHRWRPSELHATFGLCCTGIGAAWCPIHGDCNCPNRAYALDGPTCPLHRDGSDHGAVSDERDPVLELEQQLLKHLLDAHPKAYWGENVHDVISDAYQTGLLTADEFAFLRRVEESRGRA